MSIKKLLYKKQYTYLKVLQLRYCGRDSIIQVRNRPYFPYGPFGRTKNKWRWYRHIKQVRNRPYFPYGPFGRTKNKWRWYRHIKQVRNRPYFPYGPFGRTKNKWRWYRHIKQSKSLKSLEAKTTRNYAKDL